MRPIITPTDRLAIADELFGWKPHPTQRRWLMDESMVKVAACGRRWGKTESAAVDAAVFALASPGSVQMIVSPTYDQSRLIFDTVERLLLGCSVVRNMTKVTKTPYPRLTINGSLIMARTADEDGRNLRGHSADRVIVDEAAYVRDVVVDEVISPMLADRAGYLVMISTPFGHNHFYRAFISGLQENGVPERLVPSLSEAKSGWGDEVLSSSPQNRRTCRSFRFPSWENPYISREYIESQRAVLSPRQFAVEYEAEFMDNASSVFSWEIISSAVELGRDMRCGEIDESFIAAGIDWARYSDYTAVVIVDAGVYPHRVISIDRFRGASWQAQVEMIASLLAKHGVAFALTDQTSIGDPLLEQLRRVVYERGFQTRVEGLIFTNQIKREIVDNLVMKMAGGFIALPSDERLIRELQSFEYELTVAGSVRMNARRGMNDDIVIALALAEWAAGVRGSAAGFLSGGRRVSFESAQGF